MNLPEVTVKDLPAPPSFRPFELTIKVDDQKMADILLGLVGTTAIVDSVARSAGVVGGEEWWEPIYDALVDHGAVKDSKRITDLLRTHFTVRA